MQELWAETEGQRTRVEPSTMQRALVRGQGAAHRTAQAGSMPHPLGLVGGTHVLQAGAVLVFVQVMLLPKAQQVVEVVEQEARVLLAVLHPLQQPQVQRQPLFPARQHQDHQAGVEAADVLLPGTGPSQSGAGGEPGDPWRT